MHRINDFMNSHMININFTRGKNENGKNKKTNVIIISNGFNFLRKLKCGGMEKVCQYIITSTQCQSAR